MARFPTNDIMALTGSTPPYDLAESFGPNLRLHDIAGSEDLSLGYGTAAGDPRLRAVIAEQHGVEPDDVVITIGGMHALFLLAFVLCDRGDEAVITEPSFPLARSALEVVGADVRTVTVDFDSCYRLDPADMRAALSERTRLVSLASPQNPSGTTVPLETIQAVAEAMRAVCPSATLLADETYRLATYGNNPTEPSAVMLDPRIVSVASLSKCHGAPGVRIGWAITRDPHLRQQLIAAKFSTVIACSVLDEALAIRILEQDRQSRQDHFASGLGRVEAWVGQNAHRIEWVRPDAGAVCCIRLRPEVFDEAAVLRFTDELPRQGVRLASGTWFGDQPGVFRLGFGLLPIQDLQAALNGVAVALDKAIKR